MAAPLSLESSGYLECAEELIEFRNINRAVPRDRRYFDWRYLGRPCARRPIIVWAESEGRRVGALTLFPHDFHVLDAEYPVGVLGDISVREECRGMGVGGAMFRFLAELEAVRTLHGCVVLPNADAARPLGKAGWRDANTIGRLAKIIDFRPWSARLVDHRFAVMLAIPLNLLTRALSYEARYRSGDYEVLPISQVDARFDELWRQARKNGRIVGLRDARYLRWRYETHPTHSYRTVAVAHRGILRGYAMYRIVGDICLVDDVFCVDWERDEIHIVGLLLAQLRARKGIATVSVMMNRGSAELAWRRFGFVRRVDQQRVMVLDRAAPGGDLEGAAPPAWHLTAGDKDV